jgi:hypothetical protein
MEGAAAHASFSTSAAAQLMIAVMKRFSAGRRHPPRAWF